MKVSIIFIFLNILIFARTQITMKSSLTPGIVRQTFDISPDGTYNYAFQTENEIYVEEEGYINGENNLVKKGQYQYTAPSGEIIRTIYTADEDGFHPQGSHLPTAPPQPSGSFSLSNWP
ncbi:larval cuticle protein LCP-17-like [Diorhabda carinulata]|uniref:larval cuticle protein LCP-17-like n=1 Tax=Diorhabda carinulata TaxID=1163345 RepID=UPI0025A0DCD0|nr:larval cuticle protein LCP-17-like [Diorhabda carinulata]